ncbi:MAG: hypothetical protein JWO45_1932, partial [Spartobacteria bacterium]|nr:hypothetical protein [Spartobacteria bacterium]
ASGEENSAGTQLSSRRTAMTHHSRVLTCEQRQWVEYSTDFA